ncbi:MAG: D-alanyl-D-alanine carboxypeptidase precursor [Firmicutes bacterium ADurb.Bin419]|nr:MAG: D-alanyl-D-alanine carboxypeptidase precursor [Firmicutes bacterium ADurb.Bin419]
MKIIQGKIESEPQETCYDKSRLDVLNRHLQRLIDNQMISGAIYTISHKGKIIANASLGAGSRVSNKKMKPDTVFKVHSITKTFTAVAIMQLVEDGYIRLDTKVGEILPQFSKPPFDTITIMHLLTHTSGLYPDSGCFPESSPKSPWDLIETAEKLWDKTSQFDWISEGISPGLRTPAGTHWQYCSFGFAILGEIITKVSGLFAHDYIMERIIRPLNMNDTGFVLTPDMAKRCFIDDENNKQWLSDVASGKSDGNEDKGTIWENIPHTGGGLFSTTSDLIRFANAMLYGGRLGDVRILGRKALEKMTTNQLHNIPDKCWGANVSNRLYGVGFDMRQSDAFTYSEGTFIHEGYGASSMYIDPKEELAAVWFVPFSNIEFWAADPLYNVHNIIWSGLI